MTPLYSTLFVAAFLGLALSACSDAPKQNGSSGTAETPVVTTTPLDSQIIPQRDFTYKFDNESKRFSFPNREAQELKLPSGTEISIPVNCFVDKDGKAVKGDVNMVFEEFLSAGSII